MKKNKSEKKVIKGQKLKVKTEKLRDLTPEEHKSVAGGQTNTPSGWPTSH